jgi:IrrE N-terminal-like domain
MAKRTTELQSLEKLHKLKAQAWDVVNEWAKKWSSRPPPVALEELAISYNVVRVEIQALMGTAGIEREAEGFVICVNTEADGIAYKEGDMLDVSVETWSQLSKPLRFTLAHELSHLILLRIAEDDVAAFKYCEPELETACNEMAGGLLIPKASLVSGLVGRAFDADHALELASSFRVSPRVFTLRLNARDLTFSSSEPGGLLALIRQRDGKFVFDAVHVHGSRGDHRWGRFKVKTGRENAAVDHLFLQPGVFDNIANTEHMRRTEKLVWRLDTHEFLRCELTSRRLSRNPLTVLIGIQITDDSLFRDVEASLVEDFPVGPN